MQKLRFPRDYRMALQPQGGQVRGTPIYEQDQYVLPDRVWFLRVSFLK